MWVYLFKANVGIMFICLTPHTRVLKLYHDSKINWCPEKTINLPQVANKSVHI